MGHLTATVIVVGIDLEIGFQYRIKNVQIKYVFIMITIMVVMVMMITIMVVMVMMITIMVSTMVIGRGGKVGNHLQIITRIMMMMKKMVKDPLEIYLSWCVFWK